MAGLVFAATEDAPFRYAKVQPLEDRLDWSDRFGEFV